MYDTLFGNENAERDDQLLDCRVDDLPFRNENKPILTGRWGTGKTASLLLDNDNLSKALKKYSPEYERIWYVDENSLSIDALLAIRNRFGEGEYPLIKAFEHIWKAEIVRRACLVLAILQPEYNPPPSASWDFMQKMRKKRSVLSSIWDQMPNAIQLIRPGVDPNSLSDMQQQLRILFTDEAMVHLQRCLRDIQGHRLVPVIAVEPIETPSSEIEKHIALAQGLITSLLNAYRSYFQPSRSQLLDVRLTIPWHRYKTDKVDFPQKLQQYRCYVSWSYSGLRDFINKRIEWEFKRYGRAYTAKGNVDAWNTLFDKQVRNQQVNPAVLEDSFEFVLRHTHHRPRDLQRIARKSVEMLSKESQKDLQSIFRGTGGLKVSGERLKQAVRALGKDEAGELITEAARRYGLVREIVDSMQGIRIPFDYDILAHRLGAKLKNRMISARDAITILWEAGIIGIEIVPKMPEEVGVNTDDLPKSAFRRIKNIENNEFVRWFLFEYSWLPDPNGTYERFNNFEDISAQFVLHPKVYYYVVPSHGTLQYPIGA
jgi:hypothetical protein